MTTLPGRFASLKEPRLGCTQYYICSYQNVAGEPINLSHCRVLWMARFSQNTPLVGWLTRSWGNQPVMLLTSRDTKQSQTIHK